MSGQHDAHTKRSSRGAGLGFNFSGSPLLYPICATVVIFLLIAKWESGLSEDPNRIFNLFQVIAVVFFAALTVRLLLRPKNESGEQVRGLTGDHEKSAYWGLAIAVGVAGISYLRTLHLYFVCDDFGYLDQMRQPFSIAVWPEFTKGLDGVFYRPIAFVTFFADFRLWRDCLPGFHLTNILLHLICVAGVFYLCKQLGMKGRVCFAAALLFAVMPVNVQTVTWMSARFDQFAAAFGIWSIGFAVKYRSSGHLKFHLVSLGLLLLALFSKENAYVFPAILIAAEILPIRVDRPKPTLGKRIAVSASYLLPPAIMMANRLILFGDVGGYRSHNAPVASQFQLASVFGLMVRAPGEMLFGWDWLALSGSHLWRPAAILTAAIFLMLALRMKTGASSLRLILFALVWIFISAAPAHFYFWHPDPGLFVSRTLYFGAMGLAILIAVLLDEVFAPAQVFGVWAGLIAVLLFVGLQHNVSAWQKAAEEAKDWLAELQRRQPSPPPDVTYYIKGVPDQVLGVPFFAAGLQPAVRSQYSWREDIHVVTDDRPAIPPNAVVIWYRPPER